MGMEGEENPDLPGHQRRRAGWRRTTKSVCFMKSSHPKKTKKKVMTEELDDFNLTPEIHFLD